MTSSAGDDAVGILEGNLMTVKANERSEGIAGNRYAIVTGMKTLLDHELGHVRTLVRMAALDGHVDDRARRIIRRIAKARSVEASHIDAMLDGRGDDSTMFVPDGLGNRMGLLHDLMLVAYLDGSVNVREKTLLDSAIRSFNLRPQLADHLIDLFRYGAPTPAEWNDFVDHVKQSFVEGAMKPQ